MARELQLLTKIIVCRYNELTSDEKILVEAARTALQGAYAPYSKFRVGAAVRLADGRIVTGSNQENSSYPEGLCAERVALFTAGALPDGGIPIALALAAENNGKAASVTPCGACRQVMAETEMRYGTPLRILMCGPEEVRIVDSAQALLPLSFA
ncbi:MAG: cytidine deaminase, partial [Porphyromonadaceae bacterium]|nr:cytidine deaminase [Porphyromonadaceae bacterium]